jgi:hypothetical protein
MVSLFAKKVDVAQDPEKLTYRHLRRAVGVIAFGMPFALVIPVSIFCSGELQGSISGYYYTWMRNFFVGSLCAIAMFMYFCRGYDWRDSLAGKLSAVCAVGVAFFPTQPEDCWTELQHRISFVHYGFATILFSVLAYFCLVLFRTTARDRHVTVKKRQRNRVYRVCGWVIVASMAVIAIFTLLTYLNVPHVADWVADVRATLVFESTSLMAFGVAWLIKGETLLKDSQNGG